MDPTLRFAKILIETGETSSIDKDFYHRAIEKRALETKRANETLPQAYTRIVTETDEGKMLLKAYRKAPSGDAPQDIAPRIDRPEPAGPASRELNRLAQQVAREKGISFEMGYTQVIQENRDLFRRVKAEELNIIRETRDSRSAIVAASRASR